MKPLRHKILLRPTKTEKFLDRRKINYISGFRKRENCKKSTEISTSEKILENNVRLYLSISTEE